MKTELTLTDIPIENAYEGYLWWSDQPKPEVYLNDKPIRLPEEGDNPFVIEGNLWCKDSETSYLIRFVDGKYMIYKFEMKDVAPQLVTVHKYLPNRINGIEKLVFKEVWREQAAPSCMGFNVLKPAFIAFVGFKK